MAKKRRKRKKKKLNQLSVAKRDTSGLFTGRFKSQKFANKKDKLKKENWKRLEEE